MHRNCEYRSVDVGSKCADEEPRKRICLYELFVSLSLAWLGLRGGGREMVGICCNISLLENEVKIIILFGKYGKH